MSNPSKGWFPVLFSTPLVPPLSPSLSLWKISRLYLFERKIVLEKTFPKNLPPFKVQFIFMDILTQSLGKACQSRQKKTFYNQNLCLSGKKTSPKKFYKDKAHTGGDIQRSRCKTGCCSYCTENRTSPVQYPAVSQS